MGFNVSVRFSRKIQPRQYEPVELDAEISWQEDGDTENLELFKGAVENAIIKGFQIIFPEVTRLVEELRPEKTVPGVGGGYETSEDLAGDLDDPLSDLVQSEFPGAQELESEPLETGGGSELGDDDLSPAEQRSKTLWGLVFAVYTEANERSVFIRGKHLGLVDPSHAQQLFAGPGAPELNEAKKLVWARFNKVNGDLKDANGKKIATATKSWPAEIAEREIAFWKGLLNKLKAA